MAPRAMPPSGLHAGAPPSRRKWLVLLGAAVLAAGLVAGGVLLAMRDSVAEDTVKNFARAPVGCTTTLEFESAGTYTFYLETKGSAGDVGGDCAGNGVSYDRGDDDPPRFALVLVGPQDQPVDLQPSDAYSYDTGAYVGTAVEQVSLDGGGSYRLTVTSDDDDFAIAVGKDPEADSSKTATAGVAAIASGVLLGGSLLLLGLRRRPAPPTGPAPTARPWPPAPPTVPGGTPMSSTVPPPASAPQPPYAPPAPPTSGSAPEQPGWGAPHP